MAISEKLLLARDAIAATIVRIEAKPRLPRTSVMRKSGMLTTRFPIRRMKSMNDNTERMVIRRRLYMTFESKNACGLAIV
jgi:hypothetical protein